MAWIHRLGALLMKNLILRLNHYIITFLELVVPVLLVLPLMKINFGYSNLPVTSTAALPSIIYPILNLKSLLYDIYEDKWDVLYSPNDNGTREIVENAINSMKKYRFEKRSYPNDKSSKNCTFIGFENDKLMSDDITLRNLNDVDSENSIFVGITINKKSSDELDYTLWVPNNGMPVEEGLFYDSPTNRFDRPFSSRYLLVQHFIDKEFIASQMNNDSRQQLDSEMELDYQKFPAPKEDNQQLKPFHLVLLSTMLIAISLIFFVVSLTSRIIQEKQSGMKELLKLNGMTSSLYWISWFLNGFLITIIPWILVTIILSLNVSPSYSIFYESNMFLVFLLFMFYTVSTIMLCFAISIFFPKTVLAALFTIIAWIGTTFAPILLFLPIFKLEIAMSPFSKLCTCAFPNFGLFFGLSSIIELEVAGKGLNLDTLFGPESTLNTGNVLLVMALSWLGYAIIIWYFQAVWPFQSGVPRPVYFPFLKSYWCGANSKAIYDDENQIDGKEFFEMQNSNEEVGIDIRRLSKVFYGLTKKKVAVEDVSLKIIKGEITALLGHNGAGKTTTISMITGLFPPSAGRIFVNGVDMSVDVVKARRNMGFCPQHSIFFGELTVKQHLYLISTLKECNRGNIDSDIEMVTKAVDLHSKLNAKASTLSGGMWRKLSLAMAMVGGSEVLLLDEPTSGLDPEARRKIWDMLLMLRMEKTILLSTHYMEEADALGDRITIMTHGKVFCSGSPMFLKNSFDAGYHLRMIKKDRCNIDNLVTSLSQHVPIKVERNFGQELSLLVETSDLSNFPSMFEMLEKEKDSLGIENFGLSVTNMEDVFLRVGDMVEAENAEDKKSSTSKECLINSSTDATIHKTYTNASGFTLFFHQLWGLILKRFHSNKRQLTSLILQVVIPFLIYLHAYNIEVAMFDYGNTNSKMAFDISLYGESNVYYNLPDNKIRSNYEQILKTASLNPKFTSNVSKSLLDVRAENPFLFKHKHIVAVDTEKKLTTVVLYNPLAIYSLPISFNMMHNSILNSYNKNAKIQQSVTYFDTYFNLSTFGALGAIYSMTTPLAFVFITSFCVIFLVNERKCKSKHLQLMTNLNVGHFWLAHFVYDFVVCLISFIPIIIIMLVDQHGFGRASVTMGGTFFAILLYICASLPFMYVFSFVISKPATSFTIISVATTVITIIMMILEFIFTLSHFVYPEELTHASWLFRFIPLYPFTRIISKIKIETGSRSHCDNYRHLCSTMNNQSNYYTTCCKDFKEYDPLCGGNGSLQDDYIMLFVSSIFYTAILFLIDWPVSKSFLIKFFESISLRSKRNMVNDKVNHQDVDEDVVQSRNNIDNFLANQTNIHSGQYSMIVHNLTKQYPKVLAVDHLTFAIPENQCFGLLGVNGAGKTTTFSMLTGDIYPTKGNAYIDSIDLCKSQTSFKRKIGYCPQFDAHLELLTATELLYLFGRLRGIPSKALKMTVSSIVSMVGLNMYAKNKICTYSGGNKRKLSIAISAIGFPKIMFLDEPTAGIDPSARRQVWNLINAIKSSGISVILTSHSMEECEALCDSLSIMVGGQFKCHGSITHLKNKFGQGYTIEIKQKVEESENPDAMMQILKNRIALNISSSVLKEAHRGNLTFHVLDMNESWSKMFRLMEQLKEEKQLETYSISATTLEQVFLSFARQQESIAISV